MGIENLYAVVYSASHTGLRRVSVPLTFKYAFYKLCLRTLASAGSFILLYSCSVKMIETWCALQLTTGTLKCPLSCQISGEMSECKLKLEPGIPLRILILIRRSYCSTASCVGAVLLLGTMEILKDLGGNGVIILAGRNFYQFFDLYI